MSLIVDQLNGVSLSSSSSSSSEYSVPNSTYKFKRYEFLSVFIDAFVCQLSMSNDKDKDGDNIISVEAKIGDIQIDNYCAPLSPVTLYTRKALNTKENKNSTETSKSNVEPFLYLAVVKTKSDLALPKFKLLIIKVSEIFVSVETNLIYLYLSDIHEALRKVRSIRQLQSDKDPIRWIQRNSVDLASVRSISSLINMQDCLNQIVEVQYIYIQNLKICPLKVHVTYIQAAFLRTATEEFELLTQYDVLDKIKLIIGNTMDDVTIRLSEYAFDGIMEPVEQLAVRIIKSIVFDIIKQLPQLVGSLVGSLDVLGKPITFAKNVGTGIQDFFYEPTAGLLQASPQGFVIGLGKGTQSLVSGIVGGALR